MAIKTFLPISDVRNLSRSTFQEYCELFDDICDLTLRNHRHHAGDLLKIAQEKGDWDSVQVIGSALICS